MNSRTRVTSAFIGSVFAASTLVLPLSAGASEEGRRNTALGLGAAAAYLLLTKKDKVPGIVAAGAAAYAYKRYDDAFRSRRDRERYWGYRYDGDRYYRSRRYDDDRDYRNRRYSGDRYYRTGSDDSRYRNGPPGWSRGKKTGWHKHSRNCDH